MYIESYSFGRIRIAGTDYVKDVIIYPDHVEPSWQRRFGHRLMPVDLESVIRFKPDAVIVGCGNSGALMVPDETIDFLEDKGIRVHVARTGDAVRMFNSLPKCDRLVAALHLTC
jgi:hypothetical protein